MRQAAAARGRLTRIPPATARAMDRLRAAADRLARVRGREPSAAELAEDLGTTVERVALLVRLSCPAAPPGGPEPEQPGGTPRDEVVLAALRIDLYAMLAGLTARERRVLRLRLGLVDGRRYSLEEIGRRLGLSRERIGQIEERALTRLRRAADEPRAAGDLD